MIRRKILSSFIPRAFSTKPKFSSEQERISYYNRKYIAFEEKMANLYPKQTQFNKSKSALYKTGVYLTGASMIGAVILGAIFFYDTDNVFRF